MAVYIHQLPGWPSFKWNADNLNLLLSEVRHQQGKLLGNMQHLGFALQSEATLQTLTLDVLKSGEIEGELLDAEQVRSSIASRLGMNIAGLIPADRYVEGMVEMMLDATQQCFLALTVERLFNWHAALFPTGRSGMYKITVASWRVDSTGPMQVVSDALGKEKVHFQSLDSCLLESEMDRFLHWINNNKDNEPLLKAAIAHLWFVTIHPFEDGNGRITRAVTEMLLAHSDQST